MKKYLLLLCSLFTMVVLSVVISSCGGDDAPATNPKLSMVVDELTVDEGDGTIEIEIVLDKAASTDIVVEYDLDGSADEGSSASADYEVQGDLGEVEIPAGETTGVIEIDINSDNLFEGDETIQISIQDVSSDKVDITNKDETVVTINDDDTESVVSFSEITRSVSESIGVIEAQVELDKVSGQDITVKYSLAGTARDSVTAVTPNPDLARDYAIRASEAGGQVTPGEVVIPAGETTANIRMIIYSDLDIEDGNTPATPDVADPETIIMTLTEADGGAAIGTDDVMTISVAQQNGMLVALEWGIVGGNPTYDDVDMDLFLWLEDNNGDMVIIPDFSSLAIGFDPPELIFLPEIFDNGTYGFSYTYYEGTEDPMNFKVSFIEFKDGAFEAVGNRNIFDATHHLANRNKWDIASGTDPVLAQTYEKTGPTTYTTFSNITVNGTGSRVRTSPVPSGTMKKMRPAESARVWRMIKNK